ncbi:MAG: phosphate/phosphite/phosphonate ABC transporter substrate-binding protein [Deltaproteobacteria bacterium]|nr:phosphate/phosphite/phosphonate ABC transporter substrate-binding protein [Deltaproteobacteria bacterium]
MRSRILSLLVLMCATAMIFSACNRRKGVPGTAENPIRFYFMPLKGEQVFETYAPKIAEYIKKNAGLSVKLVHAKDFVSTIEAFGKNEADAAFMNTLGYLMAHDWAKTEAYLKTLYGDVYTDYRGEILVRTDSEINSVENLNGKVVAFTDPFSASGYLYPLKLFHDKKVKPSKILFAGGHKRAVEMVYKGEADAAATYHTRPTASGIERDARVDLMKQYPDITERVKIIALTDEIPNGPVAFSSKLPDDVKTKLVGAILSFARTVEGRKALKELYNVTGLTVGNDADYNSVRETLKELGKTVDEVVPGGITFYRKHAEAWLEY